ncbi:serine/threonine-protein kinase PknG [Thermosporothrix hazakensis]|jgi:serine/threonine-protein kinase PknG|uniref:non-specific serine/threonine protein kinase n=1 Tax=Thermosporothrix hazakensis TaxID=644383 RepID=A0A326U3C3_THEHA|nr:tetratricopeptide repeat protein [Thermosporothrix hazakensis]PZW25684.1 serine/threonine-protein kinase PknG [Thermosporothrix hazakensis]GCE48179.1 serine/threonine-protein kinase PknG [Thermosporothrix hazakensis]
MERCPNCDLPLWPGQDICENCGAVVSTIVTTPRRNPEPPSAKITITTPPRTPETEPPLVIECPRCHAHCKPGAKFCNRCGYNLQYAAATADGDLLATQHLKVGALFQRRYRILKEIGSGGMGAVYLAEDTVLRRQVVIKALLRDVDPAQVTQSIREHEFLATLKQANIVSIYDFVPVGSQGYIVMEYVQGKTLDQIMEERGQPFSVPEAIGYILDILPAFSYLARLHLVYCDFKPQNVMVEELKDGSKIVKLIDLGTVIKEGTQTKNIYGTHGFYAQEAIKAPSPQTDLYSICRVLAYLVSQMNLAKPFFGMPAAEEYPVFQENPALYRLLVKGTQKQPEKRFQSAEELRDQLEGVLRQVVGGKPGLPVTSRYFIPGAVTTNGPLGPRGEAALDTTDPAVELLRYGDQALRQGKYESAVGFYQQALQKNVSSLDARLRLAEVFIDQGEYQQAQAELTAAAQLSSQAWQLNWYRGRLFEAQKHYTEAATEYRALLIDLPGELPPQLALARVLVQLEQDEEATQLYAAVVKADPGNTDAILQSTRPLFRLQRWQEAAKLLSRINEATAHYVEARLLLVDLYLRHIQPVTEENVHKAADVIASLQGRTEDPRYYLAQGEVFRAALQLARKQPLTALPGVADCRPRTLRQAAEAGYARYLHLTRRFAHPEERETIVRRKLEVAPWRIW